MSSASPRRRALVDLPVNTTTTPSGANRRTNKMQTGQKRPHWAIEEPENQTKASQAKVKPDSRPAGLETLHKMPPPSNDTPQYSPLTDASSLQEKPEREQDGSVSSINFDPDETTNTQETAATEVTQPVRSRASLHVETLRLRLQLAQFKIRTNQIDIPFAQLRTPGKAVKSFNAPLSPTSSIPPADEVPLPKLLPPPVLKPTAFSSRTVEWEVESPEAVRAGKSQKDEEFRTPGLPRQRRRGGVEEESPLRERPTGRHGGGLTSSAIKGDAAMGLLGLREQS